METYNNSNSLCALKVKVKCGRPEDEDRFCGCHYVDCKILFRNYDELSKYRDNIEELKTIVAANGLADADRIRDVSPVRTVDVDEGSWQACMDTHRPNGLTWQTASTEERMKFIAKYLNQHPYRTQISDPIYPFIY